MPAPALPAVHSPAGMAPPANPVQPPPANGVPAPTQATPGGLMGSIGQTQYAPGQGGNPSNSATNYASAGMNSAGGQPTQGGAGGYNFTPVDTGTEQFRQFGDQMYEHTMGRMRGDMDQRNNQLSQSLVDRGLQPGTEAYNAEMTRMDQRNNDMMSATALGAEQLGLAAQNQYFNQASQNNAQQFGYDGLSNQRDIAQIGAAAQMGAAGMGARASMYGADQQNYRADLANALGYNQLNENGRQFDINNITQTQGMDQNYALGLMGQYNNMMNTGLNQFNAQQNANNQWWNQVGGMTAQGPGVIFNPNTGFTDSQINANSNYMNAIGADNAAMASLLGGGLSMFSDSRLKENIEYIDTVEDVNVYEWNYIGDDTRYSGVMADEVIISHPEAIRWRDGFMQVIYDLLPVNMEVA